MEGSQCILIESEMAASPPVSSMQVEQGLDEGAGAGKNVARRLVYYGGEGTRWESG